MTTTDVAGYAAAVRAALGELGDEERAHLLDDLEGHLAEIAAESDVPLAERLGPPEAYAAELRAAYRAGEPRPAAPPPSRPPRRLLTAVAAVLLLVVAGAGVLVGRALVTRDQQAESWRYSELLARAQDGQVRSVEITGNQAVATDRAGRRHAVSVPDSTENLARAMTAADVDVTYQQSSGAFHWQFLLANAILLLLLLGPLVVVVALVVLAARRSRPRPGWR